MLGALLGNSIFVKEGFSFDSDSLRLIMFILHIGQHKGKTMSSWHSASQPTSSLLYDLHIRESSNVRVLSQFQIHKT